MTEPPSGVSFGRARFTAVTPFCVRLEYAQNAAFIDAPSTFAVDRGARSAFTTVAMTGAALELATAALRLFYVDDGRPFHPGNLRAEVKFGDRLVVWQPGLANTDNLSGPLPTLDGISGPVPLPQGLLSRAGWFLLDDSTRPLLETTDGGELWWQRRPPAHLYDWYLFGYGHDYRAALRALTAIAGPIPLPRRYTFGSWYSRYWPYGSDDFRGIVKEYEDNGYPLDVLVFDMDWHRAGWTGWSWNRALLPDAEALLAWLHARALAVTLNLHPAEGVAPDEDAYFAFMHAQGRTPETREVLPFNPWDQAYMRALFEEVLEPLEEAGVDFWWLDWQQVISGLEPMHAENLLHWMNRLFFLHLQRGGRRGLSFSRWGGWGDHRYPIHFSGDCETGFAMLAFAIPFTVASGNAGLFFWSHDIGGHLGPRNEEAFVRWVGFGAFSAALRVHAMRAVDLDRRPWTYGDDGGQATRVLFDWRTRLLPYVYGSAATSCRASIPLLRPMYLDHPEEPLAYQLSQQYLFGDDLLCAPVVAPGMGQDKLSEQAVWFPPGSRWYNLFTGAAYAGGELRVVVAPLAEVPVFVRAGAPLPLAPPGVRDAHPAEIVVRLYPGEDGGRTERALYEDDGLTTAYEQGEFAVTPIAAGRHGARFTVEIGPCAGACPGLPTVRVFVLELGGTAPARVANVNGVPTSVAYDEASACNRVRAPAVAAGDKLRFEVEAPLAVPTTGIDARLAAVVGGEAERARWLRHGLAAVPTLGGPAGTDPAGIWLFDERADPQPLHFEIVDVYQSGEGAALRVSRLAGIGAPRSGAPLRLAGRDLPALDAGDLPVDRRRELKLVTEIEGQTAALTRVLEVIEAAPIRVWRFQGTAAFDPSRGLWHEDEARVPVEARWLRAAIDGRLDLGARLGSAAANAGASVAFVEALFYSAAARVGGLWLDADGPVAVALNDQPLRETAAVVAGATQAVSLPLRQGRNRLRLAVAAHGGRWGFRARICSDRALVELDPDRFFV